MARQKINWYDLGYPIIDELYMERHNRDTRAKELKAQGYIVRKTSTGKASIHPMYIEDYPIELSEEDKGFGNTLYKTLFSNLYVVQAWMK